MNVQEAMSVLAALLDEMITDCGKHTLVRYQEIEIPSRLLKLDGKRQELQSICRFKVLFCHTSKLFPITHKLSGFGAIVDQSLKSLWWCQSIAYYVL